MSKVHIRLRGKSSAEIKHAAHAVQDLLVEHGARVTPAQRDRVKAAFTASATFSLPKGDALPIEFFQQFHDQFHREEGEVVLEGTSALTADLSGMPLFAPADLRSHNATIDLGPNVDSVLYTAHATATTPLVTAAIHDVLVEYADLSGMPGTAQAQAFLAARHGVRQNDLTIQHLLGIPAPEDGKREVVRRVQVETLPAGALPEVFLIKGSLDLRLPDGVQLQMNMTNKHGYPSNNYLLRVSKQVTR